MTWHFANYVDAVKDYLEPLRPLVRRTPASRPSSAWRSGYPLAYAIAFKAGRWKNVMLVLVIAPFFTSFLLRDPVVAHDPGRRGSGRPSFLQPIAHARPTTAGCWRRRSRSSPV